MARFDASGQSKKKLCEQNAIARSTFILWERRLAADDGGGTSAFPEEWLVEVEDGGDEAPEPRGSGLFAEVIEAGALVTDPAASPWWCSSSGRSEAQRPVTTGQRPEAAEDAFRGMSPGGANPVVTGR